MSDGRHGWGPLLDDLQRRREQARAMGGEARLARQRERGRLNARERVERLFDPGSFTELGSLVGGVVEAGDADTRFVAGAFDGQDDRHCGSRLMVYASEPLAR